MLHALCPMLFVPFLWLPVIPAIGAKQKSPAVRAGLQSFRVIASTLLGLVPMTSGHQE